MESVGLRRADGGRNVVTAADRGGLVHQKTVAKQQPLPHVDAKVTRNQVLAAPIGTEAHVVGPLVVRVIAMGGKRLAGVLVEFQPVVHLIAVAVREAQGVVERVAYVLAVGIAVKLLSAMAALAGPAVKGHAEQAAHVPPPGDEPARERRPLGFGTAAIHKKGEPATRTVVQPRHELELAERIVATDPLAVGHERVGRCVVEERQAGQRRGIRPVQVHRGEVHHVKLLQLVVYSTFTKPGRGSVERVLRSKLVPRRPVLRPQPSARPSPRRKQESQHQHSPNRATDKHNEKGRTPKAHGRNTEVWVRTVHNCRTSSMPLSMAFSFSGSKS